MPQERPQVAYRRRLIAALQEAGVASILEIGCGGGGFLRIAADAGLRVLGIDADGEAVRSLNSEGFDVAFGRGERLGHADATFDAVVFCYSAHHIEHWPAALAESMRVARTAVFVLDPWYELSLPSQQVAEHFDRWCKRIDRDNGITHNDCLSVAALLGGGEQRLDGWRVSIEQCLILQPFEPERMEQIIADQLTAARDLAAANSELKRIRKEIARHGISEDGAVLLQLQRACVRP